MNAASAALGSLLILGGSLLVSLVISRILRNAADQATAPCRCDHTFSAHEHVRDGSDCVLCDCLRYRAAPLPAHVTGRCSCGRSFDDCPDPILHARR